MSVAVVIDVTDWRRSELARLARFACLGRLFLGPKASEILFVNLSRVAGR
jgi:hypothetical protein